jgi:hypothetical protein
MARCEARGKATTIVDPAVVGAPQSGEADRSRVTAFKPLLFLWRPAVLRAAEWERILQGLTSGASAG